MIIQSMPYPAGGEGTFVGGTTYALDAEDLGTPYTVPLNALSGGIASSPSSGDIIIVAYSAAGGNLALGINSSGYTSIADLNADDSIDSNLIVEYKISDGTETSVEVTATGQSESGPSVAVQVWRDIDNVTPLDVAVVTATGINGSEPDPDPITPITDKAVIIAIGAGGSADNQVPLGSSELDNLQSAHSNWNYDTTCGMGSKVWNTGDGAFEPAQFTGGSTNTLGAWTAVTLALRPAS